MTLRTKLLLAQAPIAVAVVIVGVVASLTNARLARSSELILKDNYRSVLAAQRMKEAIERIDSAMLFLVAGERADQRQRGSRPRARRRYVAPRRGRYTGLPPPGRRPVPSR